MLALLFLALLGFQAVPLQGVQADHPCSSAEYKHVCTRNDTFACLRNLTEDSTIVVASQHGENFTLNKTLEISAKHSLCISGSSITCREQAAGLYFTNVNNLYLESLYVQNCGLGINSDFVASIRIVNTTNVTIRDIKIEHSKGTGLALEDVNGQVTIENCMFKNNGPSTLHNQLDDVPGPNGGGLHLRIGIGGGIFKIGECKFLHNSAANGGGMLLEFSKAANKTNITVQMSEFSNNTGVTGGGLGLQISTENNDNWVLFKNCSFTNNMAKYGGGTALNVLFKSIHIEFCRCTWIENSADFGLAIDADSRRHSKINFTECTFTRNHPKLNSASTPRSVLALVTYTVKFSGENLFQDNCGSAIEALSSNIVFHNYSSVKFIGNRAINGGALNLVGSSMIYVNKHSRFRFENNTAENKGGALFVQRQDKHSFFGKEDNCFIKYKGGDEAHNVSWIFYNNSAKLQEKKTHRYGGNSVYATSLVSCLVDCIKMATNTTLTGALQCIGDFSFEGNKTVQFSTAAYHFVGNEGDRMCRFTYDMKTSVLHINRTISLMQPDLLNGKELSIIPGKSKRLPLILVDDFCNEVFFHVSVKVLHSTQSSISVSPTDSLITDNSITLFGKPNDSGQIRLSTIGPRVISLKVNATMACCPPGYILLNNACKCSSGILDKSYIGIKWCNETTFTAQVKHGYWMGYFNNRSGEENLASAICPKGFCSNDTSNYYLSPNSCEDLNISAICAKNRSGYICGVCITNTSAAYRSMSFTCKPNESCQWGWLIYIASELIPVTLFFLVVIYFNISFTSGPLNCLIFSMQVIDTLKIDAESFIPFNNTTKSFAKTHKFVYRMFSLNPFAIEPLSFCLWPNASALGMLSFKYATIVYSLLLVFATVFLIRMCSLRSSLTRRHRILSLKRSIIHGLSTFLVMSYSECTRVSLMIITFGTMKVGYTSGTNNTEYRAFYNGQFKYMDPDHLKYALPALFTIATLVLIPPLLLIAYPLCYKLFALLRIEESKFVQVTCKVFPLEKIKPLFDSIQGGFKDQYRFFGGLYFLYRLCLLLTFTFASTFRLFYSVTGIQLIFILGLHAMCRPYKKAWHNVLDGAFFSNLAVINALSFYNYQLTTDNQQESAPELTYPIGIQQGLITLPLVYMVLYTTYSIVLRLRRCCHCKPNSEERITMNDNAILDMLDSRHLDDSLSNKENDTDYVLLKEVSKK